MRLRADSDVVELRIIGFTFHKNVTEQSERSPCYFRKETLMVRLKCINPLLKTP